MSRWLCHTSVTFVFFFQAEDGIRYLVRSRGLGDVYKRQRHARPIVTDFEQHRAALVVVPGAHDQRSASVRGEHRLFRIDHEIQQDLLDLVAVGEDRRQALSLIHI